MSKFLLFVDGVNDTVTYPVERLLSMSCASNETILMNFESSIGDWNPFVDIVTLTLSSPAATGIITIVDLGSDTTDINNLHGTNGFTLTNTAGLAKEYIFDKNNALGATGTSNAEGIVIQVNGMSAASDVANQVELAIEHANGHAGTIVVNRVSNVVNLTNSVGGVNGNVTINPGSTPTPTYITYSGMSGGRNVEKEVMESIVDSIKNSPSDMIVVADDIKGAAEGIINIIDQGSNTTNIEHLHGTAGFIIISTDGTNREYIFDKNNALGATGSINAEGVVIQVYGMSAASDVANQVELAIEHANGHNGKIIVTRTLESLLLTQNTDGTSGNTFISPGSLPVDNYISFNNFQGGSDGNYINEHISACSITLDDKTT